MQVVFLSQSLVPVLVVVPESVRGLSRVSFGLSEFTRRADLDTAEKQIWVELPPSCPALKDKDIIQFL